MSLYFDSASTTPLHPEVLHAMNEVADVFGNSGSKHIEGIRSKHIIDTALHTIANILNVSPHQLIPTTGGTDANRRVIEALQKRFGIQNGFCASTEHSSVRERFPSSQYFDPFSFEGISRRPDFLALMQANNETGVLFDVKALRKKYPDTFILSDMVQSFGKIPIDFSSADFCTFSAHKFYGPKTVGLLYVKNPDMFPEIIKDNHTRNTQLIVGMAKAFELHTPNIERTLEKNTKKLEQFLKQTFPQSKILHENKPRVPGIISIAFPSLRGSQIMTTLSESEHICVSTGSACTSDILSVTPVIEVFESNPQYQYPIRIGLHQFLSDTDIQHFCEAFTYTLSQIKA